jgi:DNA (cytosine-5)-methyltransferase 1
MSFPENLENPSRTITATKLDNSREALIYHDELGRKGNGQYRTPTIREIAVLMSFPITYQFLGPENTKWRLVGNAVTPLVSAAIAKATLNILQLPLVKKPMVELKSELDGVLNLNNSILKSFDRALIKKPGARFRRHPFKEGNMTVALSNYCLKKNSDSDGLWRTTVTHGTGRNYKLHEICSSKQKEIEDFILVNFDDGEEFVRVIKKGLLHKVSASSKLQSMYEQNLCQNEKLHPVELVNEVQSIIVRYANGEVVDTKSIFKYKDRVHKKQLYSLYSIVTICSEIKKKEGKL